MVRGRNPLQLELFETAPDAAVRHPAPGPDGRERDLFRRLSRMLNRRLRSLTLTDNRRTILTARPQDRGSAHLELRLHRSFLWAPEEVLRAVSTFVQSGRQSKRAREALVLIREHFSSHRGEGARRRRQVVLRPEGQAFDLAGIRDELNAAFFGGRLAVPITWGRAAGAERCGRRRGRTSTIQLGSYSYEDNLIRVHRVLDQPGVPRYVLEAVVYHELLHAAMPPILRNGRRLFHTPEFRRRETLYPQLEKAERWIAQKLPELLHARSAAARRRPPARRRA